MEEFTNKKDETNQTNQSSNNEKMNHVNEEYHHMEDDVTTDTFSSKTSPNDRVDENKKVEAVLLPDNMDEETKKQKKGKSISKTVLSNVSVGVISSALTVALVSYFGFPVNGNDEDSIANGTKAVQPASQDAVYTSTFTKTDQATISDIVEEISPTIVGVVNLQQMKSQFNLQSQNIETGSGSGVIFKKDSQYGYIITNNHVIEGANEIQVSLYNGDKVTAEIVGADALTDLAVLKIDKKHVNEVASFGDSSKLRTGDEVIAIGNPLGLEFSRTVTQGIISATERSISVNTSAGQWEITAVQTDAAINPGNSGGALINSSGEVIGINSLKISQEGVEGLGFAIPSNDVIPIAEELINNGQVKRAYLGIQMVDMSTIVQVYRQSMYGNLENGIIIANIEQGSPASKAGLKTNDVIVGIDGNEIQNITELRKYLYGKVKPGDRVKIEYYRDGKKQTTAVETTEN